MTRLRESSTARPAADHGPAALSVPARARADLPAPGRGPISAGRVLALQRAVGNRAVGRILRAAAVPVRTPPPPAGAVQRAVGYEFETGWKVWDRTPLKVWELSGGAKSGTKPPEPRPLRKKEEVYAGAGFRVEADEAEAGLAELEFVVDPPVEANAGGVDAVYERMVGVTLMGARLLKAAAGGTSVFPLSQATGNESDQKFVIRPVDATLSAGPQVTAGISLGKVAKVGNVPGQKLPPALAGSGQVAQGLQASLDDLEQLLPPDLQPLSPELRGLLTVLAPYLWSGERAVFYPKQITDSFLLARTDFAALFRLLSQDERTFFKKSPMVFVRLAMKAADLEDVEAPVIGKVWTDEKMTDRKPVGPTREKWLWTITQGYDLLSSRHYRDLASYYQDDPEQAALARDLESLGELGGKTEKVGSAQKDGGIFEFRGAALSRAKLPLLEWEPFATQMMQYLVGLEES